MLKALGITNLAKLAFAISTPGVHPSEDSLRGLINSADPSHSSPHLRCSNLGSAANQGPGGRWGVIQKGAGTC